MPNFDDFYLILSFSIYFSQGINRTKKKNERRKKEMLHLYHISRKLTFLSLKSGIRLDVFHSLLPFLTRLFAGRASSKRGTRGSCGIYVNSKVEFLIFGIGSD